MSPFALLRPALFAIDPERAHRLTIAGLKLVPPARARHDPALASTVAGLHFPSPVGLAAGFDKDAEVPDAMLGLGFGFVEVGTITPRPQAGNPRPRLFRLASDRAVINRMGFNNGGLERALPRLSGRPRKGVVGVNLGANKDSTDRVRDYVEGFAALAPHADYVTINVSSPNTPGLRGLQDRAALDALLDAVGSARSTSGLTLPIFLKVAPDLDDAAVADICAVVTERGIDGIIIGNTTVSRPPLTARDAGEAGGLSGAPLGSLALDRLRAFRRASEGRIPMIAAGGVASADGAYARIRAGASLVQLYSALVYEGPSLARRIARELAALLARDGFASVAEAVGVDASANGV